MNAIVLKHDAHFARLCGRHEVVRRPIQFRRISVMDDGQESGSPLRGRTVNTGDAAMRDGAYQSHGVRHVLNRMVRGIASLSRNLENSVFSADGGSNGGAHARASGFCVACISTRTMARLANSIL